MGRAAAAVTCCRPRGQISGIGSDCGGWSALQPFPPYQIEKNLALPHSDQPGGSGGGGGGGGGIDTGKQRLEVSAMKHRLAPGSGHALELASKSARTGSFDGVPKSSFALISALVWMLPCNPHAGPGLRQDKPAGRARSSGLHAEKNAGTQGPIPQCTAARCRLGCT